MINMKTHVRKMDWGVSDTSPTTEFSANSTDSSGNSDPHEGSNVGLIVGLSVGIAALLAGLGFLLYKTRTKWMMYCLFCSCSCCAKKSKRNRRRNRAPQSSNRIPDTSIPDIPPPVPRVPARVSSLSQRSSETRARGPLNTGPLNAQTLLIDFSSAPEVNNSENPRVSDQNSPIEMTMRPIIFPPILPPPPPRVPRIPPPQPTNRGLDEHPSQRSQPISTSITPINKYPLSSPTRPTKPKIAAEFSKLRFVDLPCSVASSPQNRIKNRYMDTLPFDFNRVELSSGQYINASHIGSEFIVTQDPMMVVDDDDILWSMVWEKEVDIIVRLSADDEGSNLQLKSAPYMPVGRFVFSNNLEVKLVSGPSDERQYEYRAVSLSKTAGPGKGERQIEHYHLKDWNSNRPPPPLDLLKALCAIRVRHRSLQQQIGGRRNSRVLVHCGAGSSRSGTFIAVWKCMDLIDVSVAPDVFEVVQEIRSQRSQAVNKLELYEYIHKCVDLYTSRMSELNEGDIYDVYDISTPPDF